MQSEKFNKKSGKFWGIRRFLLINILLCLFVLFLTYKDEKLDFWVMLPLVLLIMTFSIIKYVKIHDDVYKFMRNVSENLHFKNTETLFDLTMPVMSVSDDREILWYNDACRKILNHQDLFGHHLKKITNTPLQEIKRKTREVVKINDKFYHMYITDSKSSTSTMHFLYFIEMTDLYKVQKEYENSRPVVMVITLDSYDEIVKNTRQSERSRILSEINRLLEDYIGVTNGFIKCYKTDKYIAVVEKRHYEQMVENRFKILDDTKNIVTNERVPITLSIGVSMVGSTLENAEKQSRQALEMALGRGGDQVAVKTEDGFKFFGGVSKGVEKRTKVKSRILASAMAELIESADNVLIMGHRFADLDALGAGIGLYTACKSFGKPVKIVIDTKNCLAKPLIEHIKKYDSENMYLDPKDAMAHVKKNTLLFVVDTHSPYFVESPEVCKACKNKIVIDHHRRMVESIENPVVLFHEPYASSTAEMVTELVQYFGEKCVLKHYQADALLSGIMLDTKNFIMKTGVRTFEAAAYLKKMGADTIEVKKMFSNSMDSYQNKNKLVAETTMYKNCAIISTESVSSDIRLIAPQAADELLGISGVDASFVLYEKNEEVNISARSMGKINVQVILEKLGGGGHQTMAGGQVKGSTCTAVRKILQKAIDEYYDNLSGENQQQNP